MELWIPITIGAAFCQNLRTAMQKHLKGKLGTTGATFVRFGYGVPFAVLYAAVLHTVFGYPLPLPNATMLIAGALGGLAQILGTFLLIHLFAFRNFAVGTAYSKTEPIQAALFGFLVLGERISLAAAVCIVMGIAGVIVISLARVPLTVSAVLRSLAGKPALIGLASAAFFGASAVAYRTASLSLEGTGVPMQAAYALVYATSFQTIAMAVWMVIREPDQLRASLSAWRSAVWVGASGVAGSIGWFTAMTLQNVAYVRSLAQIELVFTFLASWLVFKEIIAKSEILGCVLIVLAVLGIILLR
ncbi:DMT family transporter [Roseibium salinum]|uniref:DMT family transporter n=1 Tax=Roseibium salinum TaxID=1604349 RepID=A0ABT3R4Y4_9HYPH|nr:DMT family transporter [Roseibium sp. DSM 29163]MCX2724118.1 DMT family transporter [Roseibium sp. DSM 29163]MDN3721821.1 DMT family transporter [Roseibium salinum]